MFVVILRYLKPIEAVEAKTAEHRAWLEQHVQSGLLVATGPMVPRTGGVLLARGGGTREALVALLRDDPFQVHGIADYEVIEFAPGKYHPAMAEFL
ncbi:YciI family protein [Brevundimonas sp. PAMC22021]|uniref:YciI family protein n=1 Tax=Brevundimonas sp. PAMC22021 TaxID=2861285 RepID=UPI001C631C02|nr:YciI family protein [Brevundimonas sp. PAMC22021]QYF85726.1 YciI family protein [Brevundimonas sp. PAMC22021]